MLARDGYDIRVGRDGGEGLELARAQHPDLVLLDWMMPVKTGIEVCEELRSDVDFATTRIVMLTARRTDEDRARALPVAGKAGTVSLTHFDVGHAAGVSLLPRHRHMIKFIYLRGAEPTEPTWNCQSTGWQKPAQITASYDLELAWAHTWDWQCGKRDRYASWKKSDGDVAAFVGRLGGEDLGKRLWAAQQLAGFGAEAAEAVSQLVASLGTDHQAMRVAATYALGAIGAPAVAALAEALREAGRQAAEHEVPPAWNEGATNMEDAAQAMAAVVLPEPDSPIRPTTSPGSTRKSTPATAGVMSLRRRIPGRG